MQRQRSRRVEDSESSSMESGVESRVQAFRPDCKSAVLYSCLPGYFMGFCLLKEAYKVSLNTMGLGCCCWATHYYYLGFLIRNDSRIEKLSRALPVHRKKDAGTGASRGGRKAFPGLARAQEEGRRNRSIQGWHEAIVKFFPPLQPLLLQGQLLHLKLCGLLPCFFVRPENKFAGGLQGG